MPIPVRRPVGGEGLADDPVSGDGSPVTAVVACPTVVAHHEVVVGRDGDRFRKLQAPPPPQGRCRARPSYHAVDDGMPIADDSVSPGPATSRLMKFWSDSPRSAPRRARRPGCGSPHSAPSVGACRRVEDDDVADRGIGEVVEEAVDEDPLADVERRLHRFRGDLVRLDQPSLDAECQAERQRHDHDELDQPAARLSGFGIFSFRVLVGVAVLLGPLLILRRGCVLGLP